MGPAAIIGGVASIAGGLFGLNDVSTDFGGEKQLFQVGSEYSFNNGY